MRWADIDLDVGTLSVEQSHVEVDGQEHVVDEPKTARSRRTLPLPADVTAALRELKTRQKRERLAVGVGFDESSHVCAHEDGTPVLPRTFTGWFHCIRVEAGLPRITLHNLRHSSVLGDVARGHPGIDGRRLARPRRSHDDRGFQPGLRRGSNGCGVGDVRVRRGDRLVIADVLVDVAGLSALASLLSLRYPIVLVADVSASTFASRSFRGQALLADGPGGKQFQSVGSGGGWRCGVDVQLQPGLRGQFHGLEVEVQLADHRVS